MTNRKMLLPVVVVLLTCGVFAAPAFADISLFDWAGNIDGTISSPPGMDVSAFDDITGLGIISVTVSGTGSHYVGLFVDHEIDEAINTYFNETGATSGSPAAGQSWEIDEPGFVDGDIYGNLEAGDLDNGIGTSIYGNTTFPDDVSMAMGWDFVLADQPALITFNLDTAPPGGFYLEQYDPDSDVSVYFSSSLTVVPVPGAVLMGSIGIGFAGWLSKRRELKGFFAKK
jgi:hypothetical protein